MANIINRLFGKSERANEPSCQHPLPDFSQYEPEYIAYCIEQEQTVSHLEARLHESDDPKEIATLTLKTVCDFYGADWAGILDVDLDLDIWTPLWWYNTHSRDHTTELFEGNDIAKSVPNWAKALKDGTPVIIPNTKAVQAEHPKEYEIYKHLRAEAVMGMPFSPNPVGFLVIRNPKRYIQYPSTMGTLAYVLHRAMAQQKTIDSSKLSLSPDEIKSDKDIIINFFGNMAIYTSAGVLPEQVLNSPKSSRVVTYLLLNRKSAHSPLEIVASLWPENESKWEAQSQYIRSYIQTFRKSFSLISPYPLIESSANGYYVNHDFHIMTDLQQFDMLWEQALHAVTIPHKVELLKQAVELYKGPVFENACTEHWILSTVNHYQLRYIGLVNELLATLDEAGDYTGVQQYAARAIQLTPENIKAHYWLIHSMNHLGTLELAKNAVSHAKVVLTGEEFNKLKKDVAQDKTMPYSVLFADE